MALIKIDGAISGTAGGSVYARNRSGAYKRNWAKPVQPNTGSQLNQRAFFGSAAAAWNALSVAQRTTWEELALTVVRKNRLGDDYTPTGRQIYVESNTNLAKTSTTLLAEAPVEYFSPETATRPGAAMTIEAGGDYSTLDFTPMPIIAEVKWLIFATSPLRGTIGNVKRYLRLIGTFPGAAIATDGLAAYVATFGPTAPDGWEDSFVHFEFLIVSTTTGLQTRVSADVTQPTGV